MNYDITSAKHIEGYRLELTFRDGSTGTADLASIISKGGVFQTLEDIEQFKQFTIDPLWNTLTWNDGTIDVAPETLYSMATGCAPQREPVLMVAEEGTEYGSTQSNS